jgi:cell division protein FtsQ
MRGLAANHHDRRTGTYVRATMPMPLDIRLMNIAAMALMAAFVLLGLGAVLRGVSRMPVFDIKAITVTGEVSHSNAITLRANVGSRLSGSIFTVDLKRIQAAFEAVPWVRRAVVQRNFPDSLRVHLQEHEAVGYWGGEERSRLINSYGEVFEANVGEVEQEILPLLDGPTEQSAEVLAMYRAIAPLFDGMELPIAKLELSGRGSWRTQLHTGAQIELGRGGVEDMTSRTQRFLKTLTQVTSAYGRQTHAMLSADLRHENGYAIRLRGVNTLTANGQNSS